MSEVTNTVDTTTHLHLNVPDGDNYVVVKDFSDNMEMLDEVIYEMKNVGAANAGKFMVVAQDGTVTPTTVPFANGVSF